MKCEELNKVSIDLQGERSRMQHENMEAVRKLNDYQKSIEMAGLDKNKVASQLKDLQTMIDDMTRQKNQAESRVQSAEQRFKTVSIEVGWKDRNCRNAWKWVALFDSGGIFCRFSKSFKKIKIKQ